MTYSSWAAERMTRLAALWREGASADQITKTLGWATRDVVIGQVHRLSLTQCMTPSAPRRVRNDRRPSRRSRAVVADKPPPPPAPPAAPAVRARPRERVVVEAVARIFDANGLKDRSCRRPLGDPKAGGLSIAAPRVAGKGPCCAPHHDLACPRRLQVGLTARAALAGHVGAWRPGLA